MINRLAFFPRASVRQATAMTICKLVFRDETRPMCVCVSLSTLPGSYIWSWRFDLVQQQQEVLFWKKTYDFPIWKLSYSTSIFHSCRFLTRYKVVGGIFFHCCCWISIPRQHECTFFQRLDSCPLSKGVTFSIKHVMVSKTCLCTTSTKLRRKSEKLNIFKNPVEGGLRRLVGG